MVKVYPAIFLQEKVGYSVSFPDLIGCQTQGDSLEEAVIMSQEALGLYISSIEEDKKDAPQPSHPLSLQVSENEFVIMITSDTEKYHRKTKAVKKTLSIPEWLNEEAELRHLNFSSILQKALKEELQLNKL